MNKSQKVSVLLEFLELGGTVEYPANLFASDNDCLVSLKMGDEFSLPDEYTLEYLLRIAEWLEGQPQKGIVLSLKSRTNRLQEMQRTNDFKKGKR